jgi:hypothetical protein
MIEESENAETIFSSTQIASDWNVDRSTLALLIFRSVVNKNGR